MSKVSELFEKISHPTRVKILRLLEAAPLNFSQLKSNLGIESSGNLDHHLKKLQDLVCLDSDGLYKISDEGKDAVKVIRFIESSVALKETYPTAQSRSVFGVFIMLLVVFMLAVAVMAVAVISKNLTPEGLIGLSVGLIGSIVGIIGAAFGMKRSIIADGKSGRRVTYFPSRRDPWMIGDWVANLLFLGSYLTLLFSLIYAQISSTDFPYKPLWYTLSILALSAFFITSLAISYRIIEKANKKIEQSVLN